MRLKGKDYSIVPEYRMSERMDDYIVNGVNPFEDSSLFNLTGALSASSSDVDNFYTVYSHSDFMKYFDVVESDAEQSACRRRSSAREAWGRAVQPRHSVPVRLRVDERRRRECRPLLHASHARGPVVALAGPAGRHVDSHLLWSGGGRHLLGCARGRRRPAASLPPLPRADRALWRRILGRAWLLHLLHAPTRHGLCHRRRSSAVSPSRPWPVP